MSNVITFVSAITTIGTAALAAMAQDATDFRVTEIAIIDIDTTPDTAPFVFIPDADIHGTIGLNNLNQIVYTRKVGGVFTAFVWLPEADYGLSAGIHNLTLPTGVTGDFIAHDINDYGIVVGQVRGIEPGDDDAVPAFWDLNNSLAAHLIAPLEEGRWSGAFAITNEADDPTIVGVGARAGLCACAVEVYSL